jgi:heme-degrading monooxygenase HmoA
MAVTERRIVTVFRSVLRPDAEANGYLNLAAEMADRASQMPGMVDQKGFSAADGERVTVVVFDNEEHHRAWREDPAHRAAQERGRTEFYARYSISVSEELRAYRWPIEES